MDWYFSRAGKPDGPHTQEDIESLLVTSQIGLDTLVWSKGMAQWVPLREVEDFASAIETETPPPLPHDAASEAPFIAPEVTPPEPPPGLRERPLAGPWTRYFARSIDVGIIATLLLTAIVWTLPNVNLAAYLWVSRTESRALLLLLLPFTLVVNAIVVTVFGNSLGKAIFAIRAEPLVGGGRFSLMQNIGRELRVWTWGLALGLPIVFFFTLIPQYGRVRKGQPTTYDLGVTAVRAYSPSKVRRSVGMLLAIALTAYFAYSNVLEKQGLDELARPQTWVNPQTGKSTLIPAGWLAETTTGPDGARLFGFTNTTTGKVALLAFEPISIQPDFQAYTQALTRANSTIAFDPWVHISNQMWGASGVLQPEGFPASMTIAAVGNTYWRVILLNQLDRDFAHLPEPELLRSLFTSTGFVYGQ